MDNNSVNTISGKPTLLKNEQGTANVFPVTNSDIVLRKDGSTTVEDTLATKVSYEEIDDQYLEDFSPGIMKHVSDLEKEVKDARGGEVSLKDKIDVIYNEIINARNKSGENKFDLLGERIDNVENSTYKIDIDNFVTAHPNNILYLLNTHKKIKLSNEEFPIDMVLNEGTEIVGSGPHSYISGQLTLSSNCSVENIIIGGDEKSLMFTNNSKNISIENCIITKGATSVASGGGIYVNDIHLSNVFINNCTFKDCNSNGIKLVEKGTKGHIENIFINNCKFFDNVGMNFEIIGRADPDSNTIGYKNVNLKNCIFKKEKESQTINVSFDGNYIIENDNRVYNCGNSTIENCVFENGYYVLEMAGASNMKIFNSSIIGGTSSTLSTSQLNNFYNGTLFYNNIISGYSKTVFAGQGNKILDNTFLDTHVILESCDNSDIRGNKFDITHYNKENTTNFKALSVRASSKCHIDSNIFDFRGSQGISNLNFIAFQYKESNNNIYTNNKFYRPSIITGGNNIQNELDASNNNGLSNTYNDELSHSGGSHTTKTLSGAINTSSRQILKLTPSKPSSGHPATIVMVECVCRQGNTPKNASAKVYFSNYDLPGAMPIITQDPNNPYQIEVVKIIENDTTSFIIKIKDEYTFDSGLKRVDVTQVINFRPGIENNFIIG